MSVRSRFNITNLMAFSAVPPIGDKSVSAHTTATISLEVTSDHFNFSDLSVSWEDVVALSGPDFDSWWRWKAIQITTVTDGKSVLDFPLTYWPKDVSWSDNVWALTSVPFVKSVSFRMRVSYEIMLILNGVPLKEIKHFAMSSTWTKIKQSDGFWPDFILLSDQDGYAIGLVEFGVTDETAFNLAFEKTLFHKRWQHLSKQCAALSIVDRWVEQGSPGVWSANSTPLNTGLKFPIDLGITLPAKKWRIEKWYSHLQGVALDVRDRIFKELTGFSDTIPTSKYRNPTGPERINQMGEGWCTAAAHAYWLAAREPERYAVTMWVPWKNGQLLVHFPPYALAVPNWLLSFNTKTQQFYDLGMADVDFYLMSAMRQFTLPCPQEAADFLVGQALTGSAYMSSILNLQPNMFDFQAYPSMDFFIMALKDANDCIGAGGAVVVEAHMALFGGNIYEYSWGFIVGETTHAFSIIEKITKNYFGPNGEEGESYNFTIYTWGTIEHITVSAKTAKACFIRMLLGLPKTT